MRGRSKKFGIVLVGCATVGGISLLSQLYYTVLPNAFFSTLAGVLTYMFILWLISAFKTRWFHHGNAGDTHDQIINAIQEVVRGLW